MRTVLSAAAGAAAATVLLAGYGVIGPRAAATSQPRSDPAVVRTAGDADIARPAGEPPQVVVRCAPGQEARIRQLGATTAGECIDAAAASYERRAAAPYAARAALVSPAVGDVVAPAAPRPAPRTIVVRDARPRRDWGRTALVIGGSSAAGAGIGGLIGGKKGALVGAALAGAAGTLYELKR